MSDDLIRGLRHPEHGERISVPENKEGYLGRQRSNSRCRVEFRILTEDWVIHRPAEQAPPGGVAPGGFGDASGLSHEAEALQAVEGQAALAKEFRKHD